MWQKLSSLSWKEEELIGKTKRKCTNVPKVENIIFAPKNVFYDIKWRGIERKNKKRGKEEKAPNRYNNQIDFCVKNCILLG